MPTLKVLDGEIYYEVHSAGYPLMIFAPGGLRSELIFWRHSPSNPAATAVWMDPMAVLDKKYRVVAMDQRNAGRSRTRSICGPRSIAVRNSWTATRRA
jgi:pimeloyl-ACP methyl ester carboxylesterase